MPFGSQSFNTSMIVVLQPVIHFDMNKITVVEAIDLLTAFIHRNGIEVLNIAGSRGSKDPEIYGQNFQAVEKSIMRSE